MKASASNRRYLLFLAFFTVFLASTVHAQIFTGTGFTIVDNGARVAASCSTVLVAGITTGVNVRSVSLTNASIGGRVATSGGKEFQRHM